MHDVFYFTDIHGMYDLYRAIMNYCKEQDPQATIIFGGDACDRGKRGYEIMKELLDNPHVIYLMGNHEELFCKAARDILKAFDFRTADEEKIRTTLYSVLTFDYRYQNIQASLYNGGLQTLTDWILDKQPLGIIERLEKLPRTYSYEQFDFCHAGGIYKTFKEVADAEYEGREVDSLLATQVIWNRSALEIGWEPGRICVFGHTPVPHVLPYLGLKYDEELDVLPLRYIGTLIPQFTGEKICMDTGACFLGDAYVLNVLTLKAQGFEDIDITAKDMRHHDVKKIDCIQM